MKKIEVCYNKPKDLKTDFGNPRKITKAKMDELKKSIEKLDDFGVIVINESNQVISGNQRVQAMIELEIKTPICCKKLIGYTEQEQKAINIKSNEHSGEWDYEVLNDWLEDIKDLDFGIENNFEQSIKEKEVSELDTENKCPSCGYEW